jgi:RHS repeat-associated protein
MIYIPNNDQINGAVDSALFYYYDLLNRLDISREVVGGQNSWVQDSDYDHYGNRTIHQTNTGGPVSGPAINKRDFTVNTANNRLGVPAGQSGTMSYDNAGNLTTDTYGAAAVTRAYDAENRMTSETQLSGYVAGSYVYNADSQRVRRKVGSVETWQVYGFDGELLAEYAVNAPHTSPQKEYGYRNGQLLITTDASQPAAPPPTASNASTFLSQAVPQTMLAGHQYAVSLTFKNTGSNTWPLGGNHLLGRAVVPTSVAPNGEVTFNFTVTAPATPGTYNFQWRMVQEYVEWFGDYSTNLSITVNAAPANGANAAQCLWQSVPRVMMAGQSYPVSVKMKNTGSNTWPLGGNHLLGSQNPADNSTWGVGRAVVPASVAPNGEVTFNFAVTAPATPGTYNFQWRMVQEYLEWFGDYSTNLPITVSAPTGNINWLVTDQLGTPRLVFDKTGSLAATKRHDYLPFGEEIFAGTGGRTTARGYSASDNVRQKFTSKERDIETGLDYFLARYYSNTQGRFTSVDPEQAGARNDDPQSWNGYAYARNSPLVYSDPNGRSYTVCDANGKECVTYTDKEFDKFRKGGPADGYTFKNGNIYYNGELTATYSNDCLYCGQLINEMAARGPAIKKLTGAFAVVSVGVGAAAGGLAAGVGTGATVTTLNLATRAAPAAVGATGVLSQLSRTDVSIFQKMAELGGSAQNSFMNNVGILRDALFQVAGPDKQITQIGQIGNSPVFGSVVSRIGIAEVNGVTMVVKMTHGNAQVLGPLP